MRRFIQHTLIFLIPIGTLFLCYLVLDPFKVIHHYERYYIKGDGGPVNRNYVSTMTYIQQYEQYHYNSFIFGNSRSLFYFIDDWKKHLNSQSRCYHFSESGGSVNGLYYKVKLIDRLGEKIDNALFIIDYQLLKSTEQHGALGVMPPILTENRNWISFHTDHLINWFNPMFLYFYAQYQMTGVYSNAMKNYIVSGNNYEYYNLITNEEPRHKQDSLIAEGSYYTKSILKDFVGCQNRGVAPISIDAERKESLVKMNSILLRHHSKVKIVVSPLFDQVKLNPDDYQVLCEIFGKENVYDFSGINKWTKDPHNYYEHSHYRPSVAAEIMDSIYKP